MGTTKNEFFTEEQNTMAALMKAMGHPARVAIVEYLMKIDRCVCGDIVNELPLAQATVSQHLKELKLAGLIKGSVEGTSVCYCIDEKTIERIQLYFASVSKELLTKRTNCC